MLLFSYLYLQRFPFIFFLFIRFPVCSGTRPDCWCRKLCPCGLRGSCRWEKVSSETLQQVSRTVSTSAAGPRKINFYNYSINMGSKEAFSFGAVFFFCFVFFNLWMQLLTLDWKIKVEAVCALTLIRNVKCSTSWMLMWRTDDSTESVKLTCYRDIADRSKVYVFLMVR